MIYKQVQQSTYLLDYAGQRFLVDPIMGGLEKGAAKEEIKFSDLLDVDAVIATHLTKGAFDGEARRLIPRGMKVFVQNEDFIGTTNLLSVKGLGENTVSYGNDRILPSEHTENTGFL